MAECNERGGWHGAVTFRRADGVTVACSGSTCAIYRPGTINLITIYSTHDGAAHANPFTLDANGQADFYIDAVDCIFDMFITSPAGVHAPFRRENQTVWVADMSPWPHDMDADGYMLTRLGAFLGVPMITAYDNDLQDAVTRLAAVATAGVIILPAGDYALANTVDLTAGGTIEDLHFVGYGPDTFIYPAAAGFNGSLVEFTAGLARLKRFTISDMRFGGRSFVAVYRALMTAYCQEINISRIWAHDFMGVVGPLASADGIRVGATAANGESHTTNISDVFVSNVNRNGITVSSGTRVKIRGGNFDSCQLYGIDIEPWLGGAANLAREVHIEDCTADSCEHGFGVVNDDDTSASTRRDYKMVNCTAKSSTSFGFVLAGGRSIDLVGCDTESSGVAGINITNCNGVRILGGNHRADDTGIRLGTRPAGAAGEAVWITTKNDNIEIIGVMCEGCVADGIKITEDIPALGATPLTAAQRHIGIIDCNLIDNGGVGVDVTVSVTYGGLRLRLLGNVLNGNALWGFYIHPAAGAIAGNHVTIGQNYAEGHAGSDYFVGIGVFAFSLLVSEKVGAAGAVLPANSGDNVGTFV